MTAEMVFLKMQDGECAVQVFTPESQSPKPAIIFFMDAGGIRPTMVDMARRLSDKGYVVMLPDLYYRYGAYGPLVPKEVFAGDVRATLGPLMASIDTTRAAEDTGALLSYISTRPDIEGTKVGAVGFCMGGGLAVAAAGSFPDRFATVATFHGGNLATDSDQSPHRFVSRLKAEVYIAAASNDESYPTEMGYRFHHALKDSGVKFQEETYAAPHGWMIPDFPVYDHAQAERGWQKMTDLFERCL